jgi:hypothetical protein
MSNTGNRNQNQKESILMAKEKAVIGHVSLSELIGITFSELFGISQLRKRSST